MRHACQVHTLKSTLMLLHLELIINCQVNQEFAWLMHCDRDCSCACERLAGLRGDAATQYPLYCPIE